MPYTPTTWTEGVTTLGPTNMNHLEGGVAAAIPKDVGTTAGDIIYWTSASTPVRLALGGVGTIFKGGASAPSWAQLVNADVDPAAAILGSKVQFSAGTSPPGSPVTGDLWLYEDTTNSVFWLFRYNNSQTTYKWEFIGGAPLSAGPLGNISTSSTTFVDLTSGPTLTVPRAGDYLVEFGVFAQVTAFTAAFNEVCQALFSSAGAGAAFDIAVPTAVFQGARGHAVEKRTAILISETVKIQVKGTNTHTSTFNNGVIRLTPVRVS